MSSKGWTIFFAAFFIFLIVKCASDYLYSDAIHHVIEGRHIHNDSVLRANQNLMQNDSIYIQVNTKDSARAKGLNMDLYVPYSWAAFNAYNSENDLVGQFIRPLNDSFTVGLSVHIDRVDYTMTPEVISEFTKRDFLLKSGNAKGSMLSYNLITVNGVKGVQFSFINSTKDNCSYYHFYRLFKGHYAVTLTYAIVALTEPYATKMYNEYKPIIEQMASKTQLLN